MDVVNQCNAVDRLNADWTYSPDSSIASEQVQRWSHRWVALAGLRPEAISPAGARLATRQHAFAL
jgi:hypothetical protein